MAIAINIISSFLDEETLAHNTSSYLDQAFMGMTCKEISKLAIVTILWAIMTSQKRSLLISNGWHFKNGCVEKMLLDLLMFLISCDHQEI